MIALFKSQYTKLMQIENVHFQCLSTREQVRLLHALFLVLLRNLYMKINTLQFLHYFVGK